MKMIRIIILIPVFFFSTLYAESKEWKVKSGKVFFKSETDLESIYGDGQGVKGTLNLDTKEIYIEITLGSIRTSNNLQTSHLHDNYFEIQKFPTAKFIGKVLEIKNEGEVKTVGSLELHGVKKENVEITGNLSKLGACLLYTSPSPRD